MSPCGRQIFKKQNQQNFLENLKIYKTAKLFQLRKINCENFTKSGFAGS
jgi:hypothetical protein